MDVKAAERIFIEETLRELSLAARDKSRPLIPSSTLRDALLIDETALDSNTISLFIPHYWALYVHDGRGAPFGPIKGRYLIWWRNPAEDPRFPGRQTPERHKSIRKLTRGEFKKAFKIFRDAMKAGTVSPVVIVKQVRKETKGSFFFDNRQGMAGFAELARRIVRRRMSDHVARLVGSTMKVRETLSVKIS